MTIIEVFNEAGDYGAIRSQGTTVQEARDGTGTITWDTENATPRVGGIESGVDDLPTYYEGFSRFDTSVVGDALEGGTYEVVSVGFEMWPASTNQQPPVVWQVRPYDYAINPFEWVPGGGGEYSLMASFDFRNEATDMWNQFTVEPDFMNHVNLTGYTKLLHTSDLLVNAVRPSGLDTDAQMRDGQFTKMIFEIGLAYDGPKAYLRPDGDLVNDGWTDAAGGTTNLYSNLDEETANDADYIKFAP